MTATPDQCQFSVEGPTDGLFLIRLTGNWRLGQPIPSAEAVLALVAEHPETALPRLAFDTSGLSGWDSGLLAFLAQLSRRCSARGVDLQQAGLPEGVRRLLRLASAVPERSDALATLHDESVPALVGNHTIRIVRSSVDAVTFTGQVVLSLLRLLRGRARLRAGDFWVMLQECGAEALPIVTLISLLVGLTLAFIGAVQLRMFGAQIYVADLVGLGMAREMGCLMTGVIMAGRTGAAYAAQLGTMQTNEEIDALRTLGISPIDFLVLPRMLALTLMMPLLCIYADFLGIFSGGLVCVGMFDLSIWEYINETKSAITCVDLGIGVFKSVVFGVLVALAGCLRGMNCGRSSAAVGSATTSAVVTGIVWIVISDAVVAVLTCVLGI